MKKIIATVVIAMACNVAIAAEPTNAKVSPQGSYGTPTPDELHLDEHGC